MATNAQQLESFVKEALQAGRKKGDMAEVLEKAGWPKPQINNALDAFADDTFPVPVPKPRPSLSARDTFIYLVMFSSLYFGAWYLGSLLFIFIERAFPDPVYPNYTSGDSQRWSTAAIIIAFPVFLFMARHIGEQIKRNPFKRLSPVRRWLSYVTIFIAAAAVLGALAALIYNLLGGALTVRIILKVLVVAMIAGLAFIYYLLDLRKEEKE
jgi:Domain of unknown function (DUF5671)